MPADAADKLLVARIRDGEADAWQECIDRFEGRLTAFVDSRLGNRTTAEDVVQETFLGFLTALPNFDDDTPIESFLFAIAAHKLTDVLRRQGRRPALTGVLANSEAGTVEPAGPARVASSLLRSDERKSREQEIIAGCLRDLIRDWMTRSEIERLQCLELLFVLGYPNKEAAARLGISEQAVANHKYFVVSKLKDAAKQARIADFDLSEFGVE
ncbi:MAG: RNA polymerase sigma factor [Planctomycetota bacterium]|nr:MAG: RNA polymerase sigma factor [Planctomycetota bacterium]REJ94268.1 MAG: RNA polymerase sigma factor [Planctomycetota bacterium]REK20241.1 MAG: RNA polymerase sigma factor [Planctomycetota bacterium]REK35426.1 MAG: RNA polymerase sigma factor [Planctomycetota bacterium]